MCPAPQISWKQASTVTVCPGTNAKTKKRSSQPLFCNLLTFIIFQKFLSQPFHVAENFTGIQGVYVPVEETIKGFKAIIDGEMDEYPENAFFNVGTIEDVKEKAKTMQQ